MYKDMVGDFGTFIRYMFDSFGDWPSQNNTMVTPLTLTTSSNNNSNSSNNNMEWTHHQPTTMTTTGTAPLQQQPAH